MWRRVHSAPYCLLLSCSVLCILFCFVFWHFLFFTISINTTNIWRLHFWALLCTNIATTLLKWLKQCSWSTAWTCRYGFYRVPCMQTEETWRAIYMYKHMFLAKIWFKLWSCISKWGWWIFPTAWHSDIYVGICCPSSYTIQWRSKPISKITDPTSTALNWNVAHQTLVCTDIIINWPLHWFVRGHTLVTDILTEETIALGEKKEQSKQHSFVCTVAYLAKCRCESNWTHEIAVTLCYLGRHFWFAEVEAEIKVDVQDYFICRVRVVDIYHFTSHSTRHHPTSASPGTLEETDET